jgi:hypothetical protein
MLSSPSIENLTLLKLLLGETPRDPPDKTAGLFGRLFAPPTKMPCKP